VSLSHDLDNEPVLRKLTLSPQVLRQNRIVAAFDGPNNEAYGALRTHVLQSMTNRGWYLLGVTSPTSGAGKTLTAINLAIMLAKNPRHNVLLVDLDIRHASVHRYLGCAPEFSLLDYLLGNVELKDALVDPGIHSLTILFGSSGARGGSEMLTGERMAELLATVRQRTPRQWVIFDLPPVLQADDVMAFSPLVDANLLIVEAGVSKRHEIQRAIEILQRTEFLGTVLNKSREPLYAYY
jgi:Mrp family chromosome partitioning ATPase